MKNLVEPTLANGYHYGRPENREPHVLDGIIEKVIEDLPAQARLYPDIYSWKVTDAVMAALKESDEQQQ